MEKFVSEKSPLDSYEAMYRDLLNHLGVNGHSGAVAEIKSLRRKCGLDDPFRCAANKWLWNRSSDAELERLPGQSPRGTNDTTPAAWAAVWPEDGEGVDCNWIYPEENDAIHAATACDGIDGRRGDGVAVPLYRHPPPMLTARVKEIENIIDEIMRYLISNQKF